MTEASDTSDEVVKRICRAPAHRPDPSHSGPSPADHAISAIEAAETRDSLRDSFTGLPKSIQSLPEVIGAKNNRWRELPAASPAPADDLGGDTIPY